MNTNTMGPIRCATDAAAALAAAEVAAAIPEAEIEIDGPRFMVIWNGDPMLSETIAAITYQFSERGSGS